MNVVIDATLAAGLDQISAGFAVFDDNLRLVFCNARYPLIRGYPIALCQPGIALAELFRYNAARGDYGDGDTERQVAERITQIQGRADITVDQVLNDGRILAARYRPWPWAAWRPPMKTSRRRAAPKWRCITIKRVTSLSPRPSAKDSTIGTLCPVTLRSPAA